MRKGEAAQAAAVPRETWGQAPGHGGEALSADFPAQVPRAVPSLAGHFLRQQLQEEPRAASWAPAAEIWGLLWSPNLDFRDFALTPRI